MDKYDKEARIVLDQLSGCLEFDSLATDAALEVLVAWGRKLVAELEQENANWKFSANSKALRELQDENKLLKSQLASCHASLTAERASRDTLQLQHDAVCKQCDILQAEIDAKTKVQGHDPACCYIETGFCWCGYLQPA